MTVEVRNRRSRKLAGFRVDTRLLQALATQALELAGASPNYSLSIVLADDPQIATLNARFHHTQGPTDILSFDYGDGQGELIISLDRVRAQARRFRTTPARELALYVSHGVLHLHGYDDGTVRARRRMRAAECRIMRSLASGMLIQNLVP
ncbi:MAG TPA: rRNA maturation RNase YbeY [Verrucomicrobiae bacterium]|nr:rRNA maturation RNase YbeY [Verrucomicrobiae bacterium]